MLVLARRRKGDALGEGVLQEPVDHGLDGGGDGDQEVLTPHICPVAMMEFQTHERLST